jgi:hypothetical protein
MQVQDRGESRWSVDNPFTLPTSWAKHAVQLYANAANDHTARRRACADHSGAPLLAFFDDALNASVAEAASSRETCEAVLAAPAGAHTCGAWAQEVRRSAPQHTRKQAQLRVGCRFAERCGACGPCGGPCGTPVALRRDVPSAGSEPMEDPLVALPNASLVVMPWADAPSR